MTSQQKTFDALVARILAGVSVSFTATPHPTLTLSWPTSDQGICSFSASATPAGELRFLENGSLVKFDTGSILRTEGKALLFRSSAFPFRAASGAAQVVEGDKESIRDAIPTAALAISKQIEQLYEANLASALSPVVREALAALAPSDWFSTRVYDAAMRDDEAGSSVRAFLRRHPLFGVRILSRLEESLANVIAGVPDADVVREACSHRNAVDRLTAGLEKRIGSLHLEREEAKFLIELSPHVPLDWIPLESDQIVASWRAMQLATITQEAPRSFAADTERAGFATAYAGCGGDWRAFVRRALEAAGAKTLDQTAFELAWRRAFLLRRMELPFLSEILLPAGRLTGGALVNLIHEVGDLDRNRRKGAGLRNFVNWVFLRDANLPARLNRARAFEEAEGRRRALRLPVDESPTIAILDAPMGDGTVALMAVRAGSLQDHRAFINLGKLATDRGFRSTQIVRPAAEVPEGAITLVVGRPTPPGGPFDDKPTLDLVAFLDSASLDRIGVPTALRAPLSEGGWIAQASATRPGEDSLAVMAKAWRCALPRRYRSLSASGIAQVLEADLRDYLALPSVAKLDQDPFALPETTWRRKPLWLENRQSATG